MGIIDEIGKEAKKDLNEESLKVALAMRESKHYFWRFFAYALMEASYKQQFKIKSVYEDEWNVFLKGEDV